MQAAFATLLRRLDPPSGAGAETVADVEDAMQRGGALLALVDGKPVGTARWELDTDALAVGRVAVLPAYRRRGVATALMRHCETVAQTHGRAAVRVGARASLPDNVALYERLGYEVVSVVAHPRGPDRVVTMRKRLAT